MRNEARLPRCIWQTQAGVCLGATGIAARSYRFARLRASTPDPKRLPVLVWGQTLFSAAGRESNAGTRPHVRLRTGDLSRGMQVTRVALARPVPSRMHRRRVLADRITYVGLDVHKESIASRWPRAVCGGGLGAWPDRQPRRGRWAGVCDSPYKPANKNLLD
jgi:hypothetical protein